MRCNLVNKENGTFYKIEYYPDYMNMLISHGTIGTEGDTELVEDEEAMEDYGLPAELAFDVLVKQKEKEGYIKVMDAKDLLQQIETAQVVQLKGRIREFYESGEVLKYNNEYHGALDCIVNFDTSYAKTPFIEEYPIPMIPIAGKVNEKGYEDEQAWIGINPEETEGEIYKLYTSGDYNKAYDSLDEFLEGFEKV